MRKQEGSPVRAGVVELVHWAMGGVFGIVFGLLPDEHPPPARGRARSTACWSGSGFDAVVAPALGLTERDWPKGRERAVFIADHLLFGFVLNEMRERPRE